MKREIYFADLERDLWPDPRELERYFKEPDVRELERNFREGGWPIVGGNDNWGLKIDGLDGTQDLPRQEDRVIVHLIMIGHPRHGVSFVYDRWDGRTKQAIQYTSKGDMRRIREIYRAVQDTPVFVGTFIPFADAYRAVKEFMETDGGLPKSIEWIPTDDLPWETLRT